MFGSDHKLSLAKDQWTVDPSTGLLAISDSALKTLITTDPIEQWYIVDPEPIARGQFAVVYRCYHRVTGEEFAAKYSSRMRLGTDCTREILHEVAVCALLHQAPSTVHLHQVFSTEDDFILVMEYCKGGDFQDILEVEIVPYERDVISFMKQVLAALKHCHDLNLVHLDIKPQNLVLMGDFPYCDVKLCDFEISRMIMPGCDVREILGTTDYVAPEILSYEPLSTKTDMWSLGVLTYVLLTGFLPFAGETDQEIFLEISRCDIDFPEELFDDISELAIDFIKKLLIRRPWERMSVNECLEHPWIKSDMKNKPRKVPDSLPLFSTCNSKTNSSNATIPSPCEFAPITTENNCHTFSTITSPTATTLPPFPNSKSNQSQNNKALPKSHSSHNLQNYSKLPGPSSQPTHSASSATIASMLKSPVSAFTPVFSQSSSTVPSTPTTVNTPSLISALDRINSYSPDNYQDDNSNRSCVSSENTPRALTPLNSSMSMVAQSTGASPKESGLPPLHPFSSRSAKSTHSSTCSLYRGPSRQNLERLRSISKSREVLVERLQNSSQKKALSKSRDRIGDGLLGLSRSRDQLLSQRSFSSSVDGLSPLNGIQHGDSLYSSCSSVFLPFFQPLYFLPNMEDGSLLANKLNTLSVPKIDEVGSEDSSTASPKFGNFEFDYFSRKDSRRNSVKQKPNETEAGHVSNKNRCKEESIKRNECNKRHTESVFERLHSTPTEAYVSNKENKINKKDKRKHDNQKRKIETEKAKVNYKIHSLSKEDEHCFSTLTGNSPKTRRAHPKNKGSISHIEQRIQERHKRQQEHDHTQQRRGSLPQNVHLNKLHALQSRNSAENFHLKEDNKSNKNKSNCSQANNNINCKGSSNKKCRTKKNNKVHDSKKENNDVCPSKKSAETTSLYDRETRMFNEYNCKSPMILRKNFNAKQNTNISESSKPNVGQSEREKRRIEDKKADDEAYMSLEEPVDDGIFSRSESMDSSDTIRSNCTLITDNIATQSLEIGSPNVEISDSDSEKSVVEVMPSVKELRKTVEAIEKLAVKENKEIELLNKSHEPETGDNLMIIKEEAVCDPLNIPTIKVQTIDDKPIANRIVRSASASISSDIGSMLSESGDTSSASSYTTSSTRASSEPLQNEVSELHIEFKNRGRSKSIQSASGAPLVPFELSRSNSVHLDTPLSGVAMHWEEVCSGSVSRAFEMFRQKTPDITTVHAPLIRNSSSNKSFKTNSKVSITKSDEDSSVGR